MAKTAKKKQQEDAFLANVVPFKPLESFTPKFLNSEEGFAGPHKHLEKISDELALSDETDHKLRAALGRMTGGLSPASLILAYTDWALHLAAMPARQQQLVMDALEKFSRFQQYCQRTAMGTECRDCIKAEDKDHRFEDETWQSFPFNACAQGFLLMQDWWQKATADVWGMSRHHEDIVQFITRQWLDMVSPSNFPWSNPAVIKKTIDEKGENFIRGTQNMLEDTQRYINHELPRGTEDFKVGKDVATAEGKVVFRNDLMELIQYAPQTEKVHPEPVLMIPAWIMKYYILDLSPDTSMVQYLTSKGHTVFMISWKNPSEKDANLGMDDYLKQGVIEALDAVSAIVPEQKIQAAGYCIGGTLLSIAAAAMAGQKDERLKTMTLFTTQVDFEEAGELMLFIDESELAYLEDLMHEQGYLRKEQVSGAFNMLRSKDLIWSQIVEQYLKGEDNDMFDLMAWNKDATRLPARMHSEYLRKLYLNNELAENAYKTGDETISLRDINIPVFSVATRKDHIAPWKSVYKMHDLMRTDLTFLLTNGGHNAGVISEPGHKGRKYQVKEHKPSDPHITPEEWRSEVKEQDGSWWPEWQKWLKEHSGNKTSPPSMGAPRKGYKSLEDAPGRYVHVL